MNYTRFDRHENMDSETRKEILKLINLTFDDRLTNMMFGLFDGYFYNEIEDIGKSEFDGDNLDRFMTVIETVESYPEI